MSLGQVNVTNENRGQGAIAEVERSFLFMGEGLKNRGKLLYLGAESDLDAELGVADSILKRQVSSARDNAGPNWACTVMPLHNDTHWQNAVDTAMAEDVLLEAIVLTDPVSAKAEFAAMHAKAQEVWSRFARRLFFIASCRCFDPATDTWSDYIAEVNDHTDAVAGYRVSPVAEVYPGFLGAYAGRLCHRGVSIADTPMRVATGPMVGIAEVPQDKEGVRYTNAHAKALNDARFTVPQLYADYPGVYCSDGQTLDAPGGDYQVIEHLRVVDSAARKVRIRAIARIADRQINDTPIAMAAAKSYFMRPLIDMSVGAVVKGMMFPGEVEPPEEEDIAIVWKSHTEIDIYLLVRPYQCPKKINAKIALDLSR